MGIIIESQWLEKYGMDQFTQKVMLLAEMRPNWGELPEAHGTGLAQSDCGDWVKMMLRLDDAGCIAEARYTAFGCASALASSAALTELARGLTVAEAAEIQPGQVVEFLGGLPENKLHCSQLSYSAFREAVAACGNASAA
jgi:NifU-like protein involved in Fe-S cluster formation